VQRNKSRKNAKNWLKWSIHAGTIHHTCTRLIPLWARPLFRHAMGTGHVGRGPSFPGKKKCVFAELRARDGPRFPFTDGGPPPPPQPKTGFIDGILGRIRTRPRLAGPFFLDAIPGCGSSMDCSSPLPLP